MDKLIKDGIVITQQDFIALFPNMTGVTYAEMGYSVVAPAPVPVYDPITQYARQVTPVFDSGSQHWIEAYEIVQLDDATVAANKANVVAQNNTRLKAEIAVLDLKRIRPLVEGDTAFLVLLNAQIIALRSQLV